MNDDSCGTRAISRRVPAILCQREGNKWGIIRRHLAYVQQGSVPWIDTFLARRVYNQKSFKFCLFVGISRAMFLIVAPVFDYIEERWNIWNYSLLLYFFSFLTNLAFPVGEVRLFYSSLRRKVSFPVIEKGKIEILGNKIYSLSFKFPACLLSYAIFFDHLVDRSFSSSPWNEIAHGFPRSHRSTSLVTWAYRNAATPIVIITFNTWFLTRHGSGRGGHHHHEETRMIDAATVWIVLHLHPLLESFDASWWDLWQASE